MDETKVSMATRAHARLSASGSKRWLNCAGSIPLADILPSSGSGEAARQGTAAHALGEYCLRNDIRDADELYGGVVLQDDTVVPRDKLAGLKRILQDGYDFPIDTDMVEAVNVYLTYCWGLIDDYPGAEVLIEHRGHLGWIRDDMFGTNDFAFVAHFDFLEVVDYKHGSGVVVEVENNPQLWYYALMIAALFHFDFERIRITVVQPRARHADGPIRSQDITPDQLRAFGKRLELGVERVEAACELAGQHAQTFTTLSGVLKAAGFLKAGDWCQFCPAAGQPCPELHEEALRVATEEFTVVGDDGTAQVDCRAVTADDTWSNEALRDAMGHLPMLNAFAKAVEAEMLRRLRANGDIESLGHKLVRKKANRDWVEKDEAKVAMKVQETLGVPRQDVFQPSKLKTVAQMEKLRPEGMKPAAIKNALAELWHKPEGGITVAPIDDPREAVDVSASAAGDFESVEE